MPITRQYLPSFEGGGEIANDAGYGQFLQAQDEFLLREELGRGQLDLGRDRLEQQGQQFNQRQMLEAQLASLQQQRQNRELSQRAYEFDTGLEAKAAELEARAAGGQQKIEARLELERMQQGGQDRRELSKQAAAVLAKQTERDSHVAMAAAVALRDSKRGLSVDAWDQGFAQYNEQFGNTLPYPFDRSAALTQPMRTAEQRREQTEARLRGENLETLIFDEDGNRIMSEKEEAELLKDRWTIDRLQEKDKLDREQQLKIHEETQATKRKTEASISEKKESERRLTLRNDHNKLQRDIAASKDKYAREVAKAAADDAFAESIRRKNAKVKGSTASEVPRQTLPPLKPTYGSLNIDTIKGEEFEILPIGALFYSEDGKLFQKMSEGFYDRDGNLLQKGKVKAIDPNAEIL